MPIRVVLNQIDDGLFVYLDDEDHLAVPAAQRMLDYTEKLIAGEMTFAVLHEEWVEWYPLTQAFISGYGLEQELGELLLMVPLGDDDLQRPVTTADIVFLEPLASWLSLHIDRRREGGTL